MDLPQIALTFPGLQIQHEDYNALYQNLTGMIGEQDEQDFPQGCNAGPDLTPHNTGFDHTESMNSAADPLTSTANLPQSEPDFSEFSIWPQHIPELRDDFGALGTVGDSHVHPPPLYLPHRDSLDPQQRQVNGYERHDVLAASGTVDSFGPISMSNLQPEHSGHSSDYHNLNMRNFNHVTFESMYAGGQNGGQYSAHPLLGLEDAASGRNSPPAMNGMALQRTFSPPDNAPTHLAYEPPMYNLQNDVPQHSESIPTSRSLPLKYTVLPTTPVSSVADGQEYAQTPQPLTYNFAERNYLAPNEVKPNKAHFQASFRKFLHGHTLFGSSVEAQQRVLALGTKNSSRKRRRASRSYDGPAPTHEGEDLSNTGDESRLAGLGISFSHDNSVNNVSDNMPASSHPYPNARRFQHREAPSLKRKAASTPTPDRPSIGRFRAFRHPSSVPLGRVTPVPSPPDEQLINYSPEAHNLVQSNLSNNLSTRYAGGESNTTDLNTTDFNMAAIPNITHDDRSFVPENEVTLSGVGAIHAENTFNNNDDVTMSDDLNIVTNPDSTGTSFNITNNITSSSAPSFPALADHGVSTSPIPSPLSPTHAALQSALDDEETSTAAILEEFLPLRPTLLLEYDSPLRTRLVHSHWGSPSEIIAPIPSSFYRSEVLRKLVEKERENRLEMRALGHPVSLENLEEVVEERVTEEMVRREKTKFADRVRKRLQANKRDLGWGERWS